MKRILICAAAAIVALASCSKTQVVYNGAPEEIGFKTVTGVMTKADALTAVSMGVFAIQEDGEFYDDMDNAKFIDKGGYWGGEITAYYWPLSGNLDFAVYAPHDANKASYDNVNDELTIEVNNGSLASQTDWLYGTTMLIDKTKTNTNMPIPLKHALAEVVVNVTSDLVGLEIVSLTVTDTKQNGTLTVSYSNSDPATNDYEASSPSWSTEAAVPMELITDHEFTDNTAKEGKCYVIPSGQTTIVISYKLTETSSELPYTHTLNGNWAENTRYTYNISIGANEIKFEPTEETWLDESTPITVDPNTPNN